MTLVKKSLSLVMALTFSTSFYSCSKLDEAGKNAKVASEAASQSREEIANSRLLARSGASSVSRREALTALRGLKEFDSMRVEASKYFKAFEYQLWTAQRYDTSAYKDDLKTDAIKELFSSITDINGKEISKSNLSPFNVFSKTKNLQVMALASMMDSIHRVQEQVVQRGATSEESVYDIIKKSLSKVTLVNQGLVRQEDLKDYERAVQYYYEDAVALIRARHNMLLTAALAKLSDIKKSTITGLNLLYIKKKFQSKYMSLNIGQQNVVNEKLLEKALESKRFLESIGVECKTMDRIKKVYSKMQLDEVNEISASEVGTYEAQKKEENLSEHLNLLENLEL